MKIDVEKDGMAISLSKDESKKLEEEIERIEELEGIINHQSPILEVIWDFLKSAKSKEVGYE